MSKPQRTSPLRTVMGAVVAVGVAGAGYVGVEYNAMLERTEERQSLLEEAPPGPSARDAAVLFDRPVERGKIFHELEVDGRTVAHALPKDMRGLVFFFHGTGGSHKVVERTEFRAVLQAMVDADLGVVAPDSQNRGPDDKFLSEDPIPGNPDILRMIAIHKGLREAGILKPDTPLFLIGYSGGGKFAGYAGHVMLQRGLPLKAIAYHQARGRTDIFGPPPNVPSLWIAADQDTTVDPTWVAWEHNEHAEKRRPGELLRHVPRRLDQGWCTRDPAISPKESKLIFERARERGLVDPTGMPILTPQLRARVQEVTKDLDPKIREAARNQLLVLTASHSFNGEFAEHERDFFLKQLP